MPFDFIGLVIPVVALSVLVFAILEIGKKRKQEKKFNDWVIERGYSQEPQIAQWLESSSFSRGTVQQHARLVMPQSRNDAVLAFQSETRGSGKSRRTYFRTILAIEIPDTQLQLVVNSKINNDDMSGGNLDNFKKDQRYTLEGDFGTFYDVYMPATTQSETLSILAPDTMLYVMKELIDFDIEVQGKKLFLYSYRFVSTDALDAVIAKADALLAEAHLRKGDVYTEKQTKALVARTATDSTVIKRGLKKNVQVFTTLLIILVFVSQFFSGAAEFQAVVGLFMLFTLIKLAINGLKEKSLRKKYEKIIGSYKSDINSIKN